MNDLIPQSTTNNLQEATKLLVRSMTNPNTKRAYEHALDNFFSWWQKEGQPQITKAIVNEYREALTEMGVGSASINLRLTAIRRLVGEAADNGLIDQAIAQGIVRVKGIKKSGTRLGSWLTQKQAQALLNKPNIETLKGLRDRAILAIFLGCGLRRSEVADLTFDHIQQREGRWVIVDLLGKGNKTRSVPMASWVKLAIDHWATKAGLENGYIFRSVNRGDNIWGEKVSGQALYDVVKAYDPELQAHDLRRTHAKLAFKNGAGLDQLQIVLGHASIATTEKYLGVELELHNAPSDHIRLKI